MSTADAISTVVGDKASGIKFHLKSWVMHEAPVSMPGHVFVTAQIEASYKPSSATESERLEGAVRRKLDGLTLYEGTDMGGEVLLILSDQVKEKDAEIEELKKQLTVKEAECVHFREEIDRLRRSNPPHPYGVPSMTESLGVTVKKW